MNKKLLKFYETEIEEYECHHLIALTTCHSVGFFVANHL